MDRSTLPVAVIGAGPVGLAAAAHLVQGGETPVVLEAGSAIGASMRQWSHVQVFSPWRYNVDPVAHGLLTAHGWTMPDEDAYPTGAEILADYLEPFAALPEIRPHVQLNARVVAVTRKGFDKMKSAGRDEAPFVLRIETADGTEREILAKAVIDASGTWETPNPLGVNGVPAIGERALADHIYYGIPDVRVTHRSRYAGKRVLVVGSGHSAFNALNDLIALRRDEPATEIIWAIRRQAPGQMFGGGENDQLAARGELGRSIERLVSGGQITLVMDFRVAWIGYSDDGIVVASEEQALPTVDEIIATTGFRPNLAMLSELRLDLDPAVESPSILAPLIDPNLHSCGTVRPHGAEELKHPETDFYIAGMKSYGRAPTFLMLTGYEQVRSIVAAIRSDWESARRVELALPETGVCTLGNELATATAISDGCCTTVSPEAALSTTAAGSSCGSPSGCGWPESALATVGAAHSIEGGCCA
ncbi:MAG TPA: NAD(P)-binding domain-containing protein [Thermomicrobiales bacterium]|nr:NAD(P)-binding domain-containing protein [Thermomicrobiales bacterium]